MAPLDVRLHGWRMTYLEPEGSQQKWALYTPENRFERNVVVENPGQAELFLARFLGDMGNLRISLDEQALVLEGLVYLKRKYEERLGETDKRMRGTLSEGYRKEVENEKLQQETSLARIFGLLSRIQLNRR